MHPLFDTLCESLDESESPFHALEALGFKVKYDSWENYPELDPDAAGDVLVRDWKPNPIPNFTMVGKYWTEGADLIALFVSPTTRAAEALLTGINLSVGALRARCARADDLLRDWIGEANQADMDHVPVWERTCQYFEQHGEASGQLSLV